MRPLAVMLGAMAAIAAGPVAPSVNLLLDGDSISAGVTAPTGQQPRDVLAAALGADAEVRSVAVGGRPVRDCVRLYETLVAPLFEARARRNVIAFHAGDNDIVQGETAEQAYAFFRLYVATAHAQGWAVIVTTELDRVDFSAERKAPLAAYNALLLANAAEADVVLDFNRLPAMRDHANPALYSPDHVHPNAAGYRIFADMILDGLRVLDQKRPRQ